jgi:lipopolysaccharide transport system ATP-binding protein
VTSDAAVTATGLGKSYRIAGSAAPTTLTEVVANRIRHPLQPRRETFWALRDIDFEVSQGDVLGIIGPNGAGKSTLLKILSRVTEPTTGEVRLRGRVGSLLEVGTGFHQELTGRENIYLNGSIIGMKRREIARRFDEIVEFAGVERFLDVQVKRYSSGMSVRLAFAVAAHLEPEVLIIDEVLAVGDAEFQSKCLGKMGEVAAIEDRTVLFVSHNLAAVESLCTRCLHIEAGRIVYDGQPADAIAHYLASRNAEAGDLPGQFDLRERATPAPAGEPVIQRVSLVSEGLPTDTVRAGKDLSISIDLLGYRNIPKHVVGISLMTLFDQKLTTFATFLNPGSVPEPREERETITFTIPHLPLAPGRFKLNVGVWNGRDNVFADSVDPAAEFTVVPSDVYGSGTAFRAQDGSMYLPFNWGLAPTQSSAAASSAPPPGSAR